MADTPRVTVPVEPTPKMLAATWDHEIDQKGGIESQNTRNARIWSAMLSAAPAPEGGAMADALREMLALVLLKYGNADQAVNAAVERAQAALTTREEAPDWTARTEAAWAENNREDAQADPCDSHKVEGIALDPCCVTCEAPAAAGEPVETGNGPLYDLVAFLRPEFREETKLHLARRTSGLLRAQPQAREDAQPVARKVAEDLIDIVEGIGGIQHGTWRDEKGARLKDTSAWAAFYVAARNNTHPAPDALRVAVEKLLPVARLNTRLGKAGDKLRSALDAVESALQAEQKGGA